MNLDTKIPPPIVTIIILSIIYLFDLSEYNLNTDIISIITLFLGLIFIISAVIGEFMRENGIQIYETDGVTVENLSVRNFSLNGVTGILQKILKVLTSLFITMVIMGSMHSIQQMVCLIMYMHLDILIVGFILDNVIRVTR